MADIHTDITERLVKVVEAAVSLDISPRINVRVDTIGGMMFSNQF